jgi:hypothetical protein
MTWIAEAMKPELTLAIICTKSLPRSTVNFKGVSLELLSLPHFFPPLIASSWISLAMFKPTPEKPNPHLFETE